MGLKNGNKLVTVGGLRKVYDSLMKSYGSILFADLPMPSKMTVGNVYNIKYKFTTTDYFVEGKGKDCAAGTNV